MFEQGAFEAAMLEAARKLYAQTKAGETTWPGVTHNSPCVSLRRRFDAGWFEIRREPRKYTVLLNTGGVYQSLALWFSQPLGEWAFLADFFALVTAGKPPVGEVLQSILAQLESADSGERLKRKITANDVKSHKAA